MKEKLRMKIWRTHYFSNIHSTISIVVGTSNKGICHRKYRPKFQPREYARERSENYIIRNDPEEQADPAESHQEPVDYTPKLRLTPFVNKEKLDQFGINDNSQENERDSILSRKILPRTVLRDSKFIPDNAAEYINSGISNFYVFRNKQNSEFTPPDEISEEEQPLDTNMRVYKDNQSDIHKSPNFSSK